MSVMKEMFHGGIDLWCPVCGDSQSEEYGAWNPTRWFDMHLRMHHDGCCPFCKEFLIESTVDTGDGCVKVADYRDEYGYCVVPVVQEHMKKCPGCIEMMTTAMLNTED